MPTANNRTRLANPPPIVNPRSGGWPLSALLWLCLIGVIVLVTLVLVHQHRFAFDSDDALRSVLARLAVDEGTLLPPHWIYANGDLWIISAYVFSVLLYPAFGVGYLPNVLASWLAWIFLSSAVFGTCLLIAPRRWRAALLATVLTAAGISAINFEYVVAQGLYSMYVALALCLFGLAARPPAASTRGAVTCFLAFAAAAMVCLGNSLRGDIAIVLPLLLGWLAAVMAAGNSSNGAWRRLHDPLIYWIVAGAAVGSVLYRYWLRPGVLNFDASVGQGIASVPNMWRHLARLPATWFGYFGIESAWSSSPAGAWSLDSVAWSSLAGIERLLQVSAWALAAAAILLPVWIVSMQRCRATALARMSWFVLAAYAVSFGAIAASPLLLVDDSSMRYALFPMYGSICLLAVGADRFARDRPRAGGALVFALGLLALGTASDWRHQHTANSHDLDGSYAQRMALIQSLRAHGAGTVLTPYWNSHVLTVLSNGDVDGYPIYLADPGPLLRPYVHHMPRRVFHGRAGPRQAVVGAANDAPFWTAARYQLGEPAARLSSGSFLAWIYDRDIASAILATGNELDTALPAAQVGVKLSPAQFPPCANASGCQVWTDVTNTGIRAMSGVGMSPLRLGIQAIDANGNAVHEAGRADFPVVVAPGGTRRVAITLPRTDDPHVAGYRLCLMQEHVVWLCDRTAVDAAR